MSKRGDIKTFYEKFIEYLVRDRIYTNARHSKIFGFLDEIFKNKRFERVFEIGCGIGISSEYIRKYVQTVYSIDLSKENIDFAKSTVKNVRFQCADFLNLYVAEKFHLITLFDVLEHLPKHTHPKVFEKIKEISSEDTLIAITIPDPNYLSYMRKYYPEKLQIVDESIYFDELKSIIDDNMLEIIQYKKYGIDYNNQYRFYLLGYKKEKFVLEKIDNLQQSKSKFLYDRVVREIKAMTKKIKYRKALKDYNFH